MRKLQALILALVLAFSCLPAMAGTFNDRARCKALIETERAKRSWKTLKLWPGKPKLYYYEWILDDGTTVTKIETAPIKGVPDHRQFSDAHPDGYILLMGAQLGGNFAGSLTGSVLAHL